MKTEQNKVKQVRTATGLSQEDFAQELGVSTSTVAKVEAGTIIASESLLVKISSRFGVSPAFWSGKSSLQIEFTPTQQKVSTAAMYRDALIDRLEKELEDWKTMALRLSQSLTPGKLNALGYAGANKMASPRVGVN